MAGFLKRIYVCTHVCVYIIIKRKAQRIRSHSVEHGREKYSLLDDYVIQV